MKVPLAGLRPFFSQCVASITVDTLRRLDHEFDKVPPMYK